MLARLRNPLASQCRRLSSSRPFCRGPVVCMASAAAPAPKHHVLEYTYVPDILEKRGPYREAHLAAARKMADAGKMILAGAKGNPPSGALFVFKGVAPEEIEAYVKADPYVINGLVTKHSVQPYMVVVGDN